MATSRDDFVSGKVASEEIEASAQKLRERIEAAITKASLTGVQQVAVLLSIDDLPAAIAKVTAEYEAVGWTVERTNDQRERDLILS